MGGDVIACAILDMANSLDKKDKRKLLGFVNFMFLNVKAVYITYKNIISNTTFALPHPPPKKIKDKKDKQIF